MTPRPNTSTRKLRRRALWPASLLALCLLLVAGPGAAAVRASLDRSTVYEGDVFTLTIERDGRSSHRQPDLTPLEKDFEVLSTSTSSQVSIINGRRSDKTRWHIQLQPRHTGELRIPPIRVGGEDTAAITLKVHEATQQPVAQAGQHVFIETETGIDGKPVYVQQQIPYTLRLYYDDRLQEGELSPPEPDNAVVERLGEEKRYDTVRNGRQYHVIERNYVISAEKSGTLHIPPASFRGRIAAPRQQGATRRPRSPMEEFLANSPFANDPFFRDRLGGGLFADPFANPGQPIRVRGRAIDMTIKPRPATATSHDWLPAEAVTLSDSWTENPPRLKVGEPVSRTITIQAKGLSGSQIPELDLAAPANTRVYPEASEQENRTDGQTIYGVRSQTLTYIPGAQGTLEIPPITLDWWDTRHDRPATTTLPAWQLNVLPGAPGAAAATPSPQAATADQEPDARQPDTAAGEDWQADRRWPLAAVGGALLALMLLAAARVRRARRRQAAAEPATPSTTKQQDQASRKSALRALEQACAGNDRRAAAQALLRLGEAEWPNDPPRSLGALAARIETGQTQLHELDRSLYAADGRDWQGAALWDAFRHGLRKKEAAVQIHDDGLSPLYPNRL